MPHSISPEASPADDDLLSDAPAKSLIGDEELECDSEEGPTITTNDETVVKKPSQTIKPEDLFFTDDEDDDEFPMSSGPSGEGEVEGSSPRTVSV